MQYTKFDDADTENPAEGWRRTGLMSRDTVSVDWFEKPPGHQSEQHNHENEQIFVILSGEFILHTEEESVVLNQYDTAWVDGWEEHWSENPGNEPTTGLNIFAPGREFPYWST
ncbi:cupin domain-containing protein [Halalkalicoccus paucihalophilus]|uniref:cupin domain-containing protein n=1 Tax=Halalkalicoccus paucihalophilus TaxID=1008153 RepID=UPI0009FE881C|nr:cupin domain-containing protein [Halalkalicoccus paucihalophilus]